MTDFKMFVILTLSKFVFAESNNVSLLYVLSASEDRWLENNAAILIVFNTSGIQVRLAIIKAGYTVHEQSIIFFTENNKIPWRAKSQQSYTCIMKTLGCKAKSIQKWTCIMYYSLRFYSAVVGEVLMMVSDTRMESRAENRKNRQ